MVVINEILPNPKGSDTEGEWLELFNNGGEGIDLLGWSIRDKSGRSFSLDQYKIGAGEYLVLSYQETKISLNNSDEVIELYRAGELMDRAEFIGKADEGVSFARTEAGDWRVSDKLTPGGVNQIIESRVRERWPELGVGEIRWAEVVGSGLVLGILAAVVAVYVWRLTEGENKN